MLIVQNAKATNGRGNGKERRLPLTERQARMVQAVIAFMRKLPVGAKWHDSARVAFRAVRILLYPKSPYSLYTARHQFSANLKAQRSRREVADAMGHKSERTAEVHYGKRQSAWERGQPTPVEMTQFGRKFQSGHAPI